MRRKAKMSLYLGVPIHYFESTSRYLSCMQQQEVWLFHKLFPVIAEPCNCCSIKNSMICTYINLKRKKPSHMRYWNITHPGFDALLDMLLIIEMDEGCLVKVFKSLHTVMTDAGYIFPSSAKCGIFWIRPIPMMATSGEFMSGQPNFPPIPPILLRVIVPPDISSGLSLFILANFCSRDSSFVICSRKHISR